MKIALSMTAAAALVGGILVVASPAQAASTYTLKTLTHNIAGGAMNGGSAAALNTVNAQIAQFAPDVVMLTEMCASNYDQFLADHPGWSVKWTPRRAHSGCTTPSAHGAQIGEVVASPLPVADIPAYNLATNPDTTDANQYHLSCIDVYPVGTPTPVRSCVTHLAPKSVDTSEALRTQQVTQIANNLRGRVDAGWAVVVAGDFNAGPRKAILNNLWRIKLSDGSLTGPGQFNEADQTDKAFFPADCVSSGRNFCRSGQSTAGGSPGARADKLDHIFVSGNRTAVAAGLSAGVVQATTSDHDLYRASTTLTYP